MRIPVSFSRMQAFTFSGLIRDVPFDWTHPTRSQHSRDDADKSVQRHGPASWELLTDIRIRDTNSNRDYA